MRILDDIDSQTTHIFGRYLFFTLLRFIAVGVAVFAVTAAFHLIGIILENASYLVHDFLKGMRFTFTIIAALWALWKEFCIECKAESISDRNGQAVIYDSRGQDINTIDESPIEQNVSPTVIYQDNVDATFTDSNIEDQAVESPEAEASAAELTLHPDVSSWNTEIPSGDLLEIYLKKPFYDSLEKRCVTDGCPDIPQRFAHLGKFIVLDFESTGLSPSHDKIIEIAAVKFEEFRATDAFETLIDPQISISQKITELTGIAQADLHAAPQWNDVMTKFLDFIGDYPLVGHNLRRFDLRLLESALNYELFNPVIDTLDYSRTIFPDFPSHKLSYLRQALEIHAEPTHRALDDVKTTFFLLAACIKQDVSMVPIYSNSLETNSYVPPVPEWIEHKRRQKLNPKDIVATATNIAPSHPLYGKRIVFTGELSCTRVEAMQMAVNCGALPRTSVSGKTDFLVVGRQDLSLVGDSGISTKEATARALNIQGKAHIQIIDENGFRELVEDVPN